MSDWDSVTKIGSRVGPGGSAARTQVVKGKSSLNAAARTGSIVATEKKYGSANTPSGTDGRHLTKVDRADDIVKPKTVDRRVGQIIAQRRGATEPKLSQKDLATRCNTTANVISSYEKGDAIPDQKLLSAMERVLNVKLRGQDIGQDKFPKKNDAAKGGKK